MIKKDNYSLLSHNTFGIDVNAKVYVEYDSEEELMTVLPSLKGNLLHIGGGSNLLFRKDYEGTVLHSAIKGIEVVEEQAPNETESKESENESEATTELAEESEEEIIRI